MGRTTSKGAQFWTHHVELIFPRDTGHQVKDHIMIRNEVIDEKATQEP